MTAPLSPAPALTAEEAARVNGDDSREEPDAVLVDGDWISPSREAHARDLTKSWADAAQTAGCPTAFVARMRTFVEVHDRNHRTALAALAGQPTTDEDSNTADELAAAGLRACCGQPSERHCQ